MRIGLVVCVAFLLLPRAVEAQAGSLVLTVTRINGPGGDRDENAEIIDGVNLADCANPAETEITIQVGANPVNSLDLWVALTNNCEAATTRSGTTQTCFDINRQVAQLDSNMSFIVTLDELTSEDPDGPDPCDDIKSPQGGNYYLHVYDSPNESTTGDLPADMKRGVVAIPVDVAAPNAPEITSGDVSGEGELDIAFDAGEGDSDVMNYTYQFYNVGACGGGGADGGVTGTPVGAPFSGTSGIRPSDLGLEIGESAGVALQAIDPAGNTSELSNSICVTHVETMGFCDSAGACSGTCSVVAPGGDPGRPLALVGLVGALGLAFHRARRRARGGRTRA